MPWRTYDLGKAIGRIIRESPYRAVVIGSSSWSHASLTIKNRTPAGTKKAYRQPNFSADFPAKIEAKNPPSA